MNTADITGTLGTLLSELVDGASKDGGYMLNPGDEGLLRSLDKLSAADASALTPTGSSIAAHADHIRYGLSLMNRWSQGEDPFESADWKASWTRTRVTEPEWRQRVSDLRAETARWLGVVRTPREIDEVELNGMIGSIAHLAYHLGAVRQINQSARGPKDTG
jgi:hypothetical protein